MDFLFFNFFHFTEFQEHNNESGDSIKKWRTVNTIPIYFPGASPPPALELGVTENEICSFRLIEQFADMLESGLAYLQGDRVRIFKCNTGKVQRNRKSRTQALPISGF
ncbi:hypothetical protein CEXT_143791, partial [Caerostris extrusa]